MKNNWSESVDKLVRNRIPESDEAYQEFLEGLDETAEFLYKKKQIESIPDFVSNIVKVFENDNDTEDYIATVEGLVFDLVEFGYIDNLGLFNLLIDNLEHFISSAQEWGGEIFMILFSKMAKQNDLNYNDIETILNSKDKELRELLKSFILELDYADDSPKKREVIEKCLTILS